MPLHAEQVAASSSIVVDNLTNQVQNHYGVVGVNQIPIFTVPGGEPDRTIRTALGCHNFQASTGPVPIPGGAYTSGGTDQEMIVDQPSTGTAWELWRAYQLLGSTWSACWGGRLSPTTSTGIFDGHYGMSATGISYLATTITEADVAAGVIDHTIALQVDNCDSWVSPAVRGDCGTGVGAPPEGTWFVMPPTVSMPSGMTPFAQMVFRALQTYGAVVTDHAEAVMTVAEDHRDWSFQGHQGVDPITQSWAGLPQYRVLDGIPWSDLQVIDPPAGF